MGRRWTLFSLPAAILFVTLTTPARAGETGKPANQNPDYPRAPSGLIQAEFGLAYLGELVSGNGTPGAFSYGLKGGVRAGRWDFILVAEHGFWRDNEGRDELSVQTLNLGLGAGLLYFKGHMRASVMAGVSILMTHSQLDEPGTVGAFVDLRPTGFRWPVGDKIVVELHPLTFALVMPTTSGIPLLYMTYRTTLAMELKF